MPSASSPKSKLKPAAVRPGDKIGIVAPASPIDRAAFDAGCARLRQLGYEPVFSQSIFDCDLFFAGTAERRARELEEMFERDEVRAILCARGGYGCNYLLKLLDPEKIRRRPKIFIGYSDITTLQTFLLDRAGLVTFHGPMLAKDFAVNAGVDQASWDAALSGQSGWKPQTEGVKALVRGESEGILYGGCLSLLTASLGTRDDIKTEGTILFLEDVATKPFQIDRMLMQLRLAGKFSAVRGIIFGEMLDCVQPGGQDYTLEQVVQRALGNLKIPIAFGLRSGHVSRANVTLPLGVKAKLSVTDRVELTLLESATVPAAHAKARPAR
jgi:muramoyltetrapeptide carboxypeptidase